MNLGLMNRRAAVVNYKDYRIIKSIKGTSQTLNTGIVPNDQYYSFEGVFTRLNWPTTKSWAGYFRAYSSESANSYRLIQAQSISLKTFWFNCGNSPNSGGSYNDFGNTIDTPIKLNFKMEFGKLNVNGTNYSTPTTQRDTLTGTMRFMIHPNSVCEWERFTTKYKGEVIQDLYPCVDKNGQCGFVDVHTDTIIYFKTPIYINSQT